MKKQIVIILAAVICGSALSTQHVGEIHERGVTLLDLPHDPALFREDVRPHVERIIAAHGEEEWQTVVLTSEFHTHLGIYSIVGAKMGLRARDYFDAGIDEMLVTSFAGLKPPVSCLNDGLQVSTGATLGHGTISVADGSPTLPKAVFTHDDKSISLQLKDRYWKTVRTDIKNILKDHGLDDPQYWQLVRKLGIQYWLQWSRNDIFDITIVDTPQSHASQTTAH